MVIKSIYNHFLFIIMNNKEEEMKRLVLVLVVMVSFLGLAGCAQSNVDMIDFIDVEFQGLDTRGFASYSINYDRLHTYLYENDLEIEFEDDMHVYDNEEFEDILEISFDNSLDLSNGDTVKLLVSVDLTKVKNLTGGEKEVTVEGLDEPKWLTSEEVEKHLVVNFNGVSGRGEAQIDNTLPDELGGLPFQLVGDGEFKNGDTAKIEVSAELQDRLVQHGYLLEDSFDPRFEVKGLAEVAEKAGDIANLEDIKRMIDEETTRTYKDWWVDKEVGTRYEIKEEKLLYRQFTREDNDSQNLFGYRSTTNNGNLIKIFSIKEYSGGTEGKLKKEYTAIIGFSDLYLDEENRVNVADLVTIKDTKDSTYSLESVIQLYEGYGYTEVED